MKKKTTSLTLESGYFHTGNSGITLSIKEITNSSDRQNYRFDITHGASGAHTTVSFPLGSDHMVEYMIEALERVRDRMKEKDFQNEHAFEMARRSNADSYVEIINGLKRVSIRREYIVGTNSTEIFIVGYEYFDEFGNLVKTDLFNDEQIKVRNLFERSGSGSSGGEPMYDLKDIG